MKQVTKTPEITSRLRQSVGPDANLDNLAVFEAIGLNTLPLRKQHPLFKGAVTDRSLLHDMAAALSQESRPLQIMHNDEPLPIGRVFHGAVVDKGAEAELRVLFFVDHTTNAAQIANINNGTVDQVSVSILPKHIYNSVSGFDYLGPDATGENVWTGTDSEGNTIGENGVFGRLVGLDQFFEMSLVGMGGAQNARIVSRDQSHFGSSHQKLAASGLDPNFYVLTANTRNPNMDLTALIQQLTDVKADLAVAKTAKTADDAKIAELTAKVGELTQKLTDAGDSATALAAKDTQIADLTAKVTSGETALNAAVTALQGVATKVLTAAGKKADNLPTVVAELETLINETSTSLVAALANGGKARDTITDAEKGTPVASLGVFRSPRR